MTSQHQNPESPMVWTDAFVLGYPPMDDIHQELVDLLGRMQQAPDAALQPLLQELDAHLRAHFGFEDDLMQRTEFPPRQCHIDEHAAVLRSIDEVHTYLEQGEVMVCRRLVDALVDWFPSHADHLDSALAHWLVKRDKGGKPVVLRRGLNLR